MVFKASYLVVLGSLFSINFSPHHFILWLVVTFQRSTFSTVQVCVCSVCMHACWGDGWPQLKCSFLGSTPSRACLLLLGCSAGRLSATACQFKLEEKAKFHQSWLWISLELRWRSLQCSGSYYCNTGLWLNVSISMHGLTLHSIFT